MTERRRAERVERRLSPEEHVLVWLDEAHRFPTVNDYVRSMLDEPRRGHPFDALAEAVAQTVRGSGRRPPDAPIGRAVGDAAFRYQLVLVLNGESTRLAELCGLRVALAGRLPGDLVTNPLWLGGPASAFDGDAAEEFDAEREAWLRQVESVTTEVRVEDGARLKLEERYFGRRSVLFSETSAAWGRVLAAALNLESLASGLPVAARRRRKSRPDRAAPPSVQELIALRADELRLEARMAAFGLLGKHDRQVALAEARLRR